MLGFKINIKRNHWYFIELAEAFNQKAFEVADIQFSVLDFLHLQAKTEL